jgi:hypothetical protein
VAFTFTSLPDLFSLKTELGIEAVNSGRKMLLTGPLSRLAGFLAMMLTAMLVPPKFDQPVK